MKVLIRRDDGYVDKLDLGQPVPTRHEKRDVPAAALYQDGPKYLQADGMVRVEPPPAPPPSLLDEVVALKARIAALESKVQ